jgi:hypothetical protein
MLAEALRETGGALSDDERAWADDILGADTTAACWYSWPERARPAPPSPFRRRHWRKPSAALTGRLGWHG